VGSPDGDSFFYNKALNQSKYNLTQVRASAQQQQQPRSAPPGRLP
jgi:hypothetical protein